MLVFADMNVIRLTRFLLLMLFALLQCVAPLAHAHVNGDSVDQNVHLAMPELPGFTDHHHDYVATSLVVDGHHLAVDEHHTSVVCMPPEYRSASLSIAQPVDASKPTLLLQCELAVVIHCNEHYLPALPLSPYLHPCSQAPPA